MSQLKSYSQHELNLSPFYKVLFSLFAFFISFPLLGESHTMIATLRPADQDNIFVSQSLEGEYGLYNKYLAGSNETDQGISSRWKGYGFRSSVGVESMRFIQFALSHTFINMRSKSDSFNVLTGSRLAGEVRLVFFSPIGNVEIGGGALGSLVDIQDQLTRATYTGRGYFYTLGLNYFMNNSVSLFMQAKLINENLLRDRGTSLYDNIKTEMTSGGIGCNIWL
jgi:hypothetical protein